MNIRQAIKMAWKSIWGKKGRSALTILGIFIGIAAVMTIVSVSEGMQKKATEQFEAMGSNRISVDIYTWTMSEDSPAPKDYFPQLSDYCKGIQQYVLGVTPSGWCGAVMSYGTKSTDSMTPEWHEDGSVTGDMPPELVYGSDQYSICENLEIARGRDLAILDIRNVNQVCVMGATAAKTFFGSINPVGQTVLVNGNKFEVVGVYAPRIKDQDRQQSWMDNKVVFPYTTRQILGDEVNNRFLVKARDAKSMTEAISRIGGFLRANVDQSSGGFNVMPENKWQEESNKTLNMIGLVLAGIAAISLVVGGIGIMNIMLVTVTERTREIGIRRAIGAQRSSIVAQFLIEAAMLCCIGGLLGILVGTACSMALSKLLLQMTIYPDAKVTLIALGLSVALGVVFGSYPAMKASRLQPVEALRAE